MKKFLLFILFFTATQAIAWDGYDYDTNSYIEIERGNLVREGEMIEIYDYQNSTYRDVEVQSIDSNGDLEVYDYSTGEYREFDMD